jgi:hypothetical protein
MKTVCFEYIRKLTRLRSELEPLKRGALINLYVSDQQYAYTRKIRPKAGEAVFNSASAIVVINNDSKPATVEFDVGPVGLSDGEDLRDQLDLRNEVKVTGHRLKVKLAARSAAIFANQ